MIIVAEVGVLVVDGGHVVALTTQINIQVQIVARIVVEIVSNSDHIINRRPAGYVNVDQIVVTAQRLGIAKVDVDPVRIIIVAIGLALTLALVLTLTLVLALALALALILALSLILTLSILDHGRLTLDLILALTLFIFDIGVLISQISFNIGVINVNICVHGNICRTDVNFINVSDAVMRLLTFTHINNSTY